MLPKTTVFGIEVLWRFFPLIKKSPFRSSLVFFENLYPIKLYTQKTKGMVTTESRWEINAIPAAAEVSCP